MLDTSAHKGQLLGPMEKQLRFRLTEEQLGKLNQRCFEESVSQGARISQQILFGQWIDQGCGLIRSVASQKLTSRAMGGSAAKNGSKGPSREPFTVAKQIRKKATP